MDAEQFVKEKFPGLDFSQKELETIWLGQKVLESELANPDTEKVPPPEPTELLFSSKRNLAILAHQQKFEINDRSWERVFDLTLTNQKFDPPMVRNDAVYKVTTTRGPGIFVISTKRRFFQSFSFYKDKNYPYEAYHLMCLGEVEQDEQTPGKIERDQERIQKTEEEFQDPLEARSWISSNKEGSFANHIFSGKKDALEFVDELYGLGALQVSIPAEGIWKAKEDDPQGVEFFADLLTVRLPNEKDKREAIFSFLNRDEALSEHYKEEGQKTIFLELFEE